MYTVDNGFVLVPIDYFKCLIEQKMKLCSLENGGVDNWEFYDISLFHLDKWKEEWNKQNPNIQL